MRRQAALIVLLGGTTLLGILWINTDIGQMHPEAIITAPILGGLIAGIIEPIEIKWVIKWASIIIATLGTIGTVGILLISQEVAQTSTEEGVGAIVLIIVVLILVAIAIGIAVGSIIFALLSTLGAIVGAVLGRKLLGEEKNQAKRRRKRKKS